MEAKLKQRISENTEEWLHTFFLIVIHYETRYEVVLKGTD